MSREIPAFLLLFLSGSGAVLLFAVALAAWKGRIRAPGDGRDPAEDPA